MKEFLKDALESLSYLIYAISTFILIGRTSSVKKGILFAYYVFATIFITIACYTPNDQINRLLYNIFFFITICVFSYYYKTILPGKARKNIINILFLINLIIFVKVGIISNQLLEINNYVYAITYLSIVIYAFLYFENILKNVDESNLLHEFNFWLTSGYLLYFLSCFFLILFYENVDVSQRALLWSLQNVILFVSSILTLCGSLWIYYSGKYS